MHTELWKKALFNLKLTIIKIDKLSKLTKIVAILLLKSLLNCKTINQFIAS